ncbi:hypothetical protein ASC94_10065 [Massilia sp. Root418]|nr:hypothetical protein ASC94_10065 [Massilia sp. Root418]
MVIVILVCQVSCVLQQQVPAQLAPDFFAVGWRFRRRCTQLHLLAGRTFCPTRFAFHTCLTK